MWGTKKLDAPRSAAPEPRNLQMDEKNTAAVQRLEATAGGETGWLKSGLHVKGDINGTEDLVIDGTVEGQIRLSERKLTVGSAAKVTADIDARDVVVYGYVKGNIRAKGRIEIKKNGAVIGNLTTAQIMIEDGADFKGLIEIERGAAKETDRGAFPRAASASAGSGPTSM
jgi:cytoskeletal protein CcmA (bactofilin family)